MANFYMQDKKRSIMVTFALCSHTHKYCTKSLFFPADRFHCDRPRNWRDVMLTNTLTTTTQRNTKKKKRKLKGSIEAALGSMVSKGESEICASTFLFFLPIISDFRCCTDISSSHSARLFGDYDLIGKKFS